MPVADKNNRGGHHKDHAHHEHELAAEKIPFLKIDICIISDSRTEATDETGKFLKAAISDSEVFRVGTYNLINNNPDNIKKVVDSFLSGGSHVLITSGGTGISSRDVTIDTLEAMFVKKLAGFGEIFRLLSYEQIGVRAMMSRASAGIIGDRVVVSLPGSKNAVTMAYEKILVPQLRHLVYEATR